MSGRDFAHVQDDVNPHILRMLKGTFSLGAVRICSRCISCLCEFNTLWFLNDLFYSFVVCYFIFGSIVYNRAIVYKRYNFLKVVVHVIIIDQCN